MLSIFKPGAVAARSQLPEGVRIYAIGDIHGCAHLLEQVFATIDADLKRRPCEKVFQVFVGDYIDRGPNSRGTIDLLIARGRGHRARFLQGNHEAFMLEFLRDPAALRKWQQSGGLETLMSYGLTPPLNAGADEQAELSAALGRALPPSHHQFLARLRPFFVCGDYFFAHAGIRPGVPLSEQRQDDLMWIREEFLLCEEDFGRVVVHGHTPVREPDFRPNRINIDTGAYATGRLTCLMLERDDRQVM